MVLSVEDLTEPLQWFVVAYPTKHRILLSFAHRTIEKALNQSLSPTITYEYLKKMKYKYIEVDLEINKFSTESQSKNEEHLKNSRPERDDGWEDIEDILARPLLPNENRTDVGEEKYNDNYRLLQEYERTNNKVIRNNIIAANLQLVQSIAIKCKKYMNHDLSLDDLIQEGIFGLMDAVERYDITYGGQLSTYATYWIRQRIIRAIINTGTTVRIPVYMLERIRAIKKVEASKRRDNSEGNPSIDEVCEVLGISMEHYYEAKLTEHRFLGFVSLNQMIGDGDQDTELLEFVPNDSLEVLSSLPREFQDPAIVAEQSIIRENIKVILEELSERQQGILEFRFGLRDGRNRSLEEVGKIYGITRERVRQIEAGALGKLRKIRNRQKWIWIS
jgi:RNA polymerase primary sigma factor